MSSSHEHEQKFEIVESKEAKSIASKEGFWVLRDLFKAAQAGQMDLLKQLTKQWERLQLSPHIQVALLKATLKASDAKAFIYLLPFVPLDDSNARKFLEKIALGRWSQSQKQAALKALMAKKCSRSSDKRNFLKKRITSEKVNVTLPPHLNALTEGEVNITRLDKNLLQQRDSEGNSIVHHASANGRLETLQALQSSPRKLFTALTVYTKIQSSNIYSPIYDDASILASTLSTDHPTVYIDGELFPWGPLFLAIENGHTDVMDWWLKQPEGEKIGQYNFQPYGPSTHNAFLWAIQRGYLETAKWLAALWEKNGMTSEQRNHLLGTALLIAINQAHLNIVKWLVDDKDIGLNINTVFVQHNRFSGDPTQKKLEELSPIPGDSFGWGKHKRPDGDYHRNFLFLSALSVQLCEENPRHYTDSNQTKASASTSSNNAESKEAKANAEPSTAQIELARKAAADIAEHLNAIDGEIQLVGIDDSLWEAEISPTGQASAVITFNKEISKATVTTLQEKYREYKFSTSSSATTSSVTYSLHATRKTQQELAALTRSGSFSYSERGGSQSFPLPSPKAQGDAAGEKKETKKEQKGLSQPEIAAPDTVHPLGETPAQIQQRAVVGVNSRAEENTQSVTRR